MKHDAKRYKSGLVVLVTTVLAASLLAGCTNPISREDVDPTAPLAILTTDNESAFVGEVFRFDASESRDPNGKIERYTFDFGDGTKRTVDAEDDEDATIEHRYTAAGEYRVELSVVDDGAKQDQALSDTATIDVAVNDRLPVAGLVLNTPQGDAGSENFTQPFEVSEGADRFRLELDISGRQVLGDSEIEIAVVDPTGEKLEEETIQVPPDGNESVVLEGGLTAFGTYEVLVSAKSGAADVRGTLFVYYDEPISEA